MRPAAVSANPSAGGGAVAQPETANAHASQLAREKAARAMVLGTLEAADPLAADRAARRFTG
jgi:hypothetical protein